MFHTPVSLSVLPGGESSAVCFHAVVTNQFDALKVKGERCLLSVWLVLPVIDCQFKTDQHN